MSTIDQDSQTYERYIQYLCQSDPINLTLDISRMNFDQSFLDNMEPQIQEAYLAMQKLEQGGMANPSEKRMVGHYWLRNPSIIKNVQNIHDGDPMQIVKEITQTILDIKTFAHEIHTAANENRKPQNAPRFTDVLLIGIGGSALGPQFIADALSQDDHDKMTIHFSDNTDPDGINRVLNTLKDKLDHTLCLVISKSGRTPETKNGMIATKQAYKSAGLDFYKHAVAITELADKSDLYCVAKGINKDFEGGNEWLARFPMWDWVGGRTSVTSAVGLLPAALQGLDIDALLKGAADCDQVTRTTDTSSNPAALLSLMWYHATNGKGEKDMVLLPYRDRLLLFSRYLQQLVMESIGKSGYNKNKEQQVQPDQGIAVYGNKGSTDQHAYVQQLRDGINNFFITFIEVLENDTIDIDLDHDGETAADYLHGFMLGTRLALAKENRESITITIPRVDAYHIGVLIALFERAVGFYATLVNINAYDQPGVEAGKKAASAIIAIQKQILSLIDSGNSPDDLKNIAAQININPNEFDPSEVVETVHKIITRLKAANRI